MNFVHSHIKLNSNLLTVNCKKSQWMKTRIINKQAEDLILKLGNNELEYITDYKYLGINVDTFLNFLSYRDSIINRVNLKISYFRKIRNYLTFESALLIL